MSVQRLPSGMWRPQVWHEGKNVGVSAILGPPGTFTTKREAMHAAARARERIGHLASRRTTVAGFRDRWVTDPLFATNWRKESTRVRNMEGTKAFVEAHGALRLDQVGDRVVAEWLGGGKRNSTVPALRAMFNAAASAKAGRLIGLNPFAGLGISKGPGRANLTPPSEEQVWTIISEARKVACPSLAAWLQTAAFTGMRPGELDALRPGSVDLERNRIRVVEQFSGTTRTFTLPKNGLVRDAPLTPPARAALLSVPAGEFCFPAIRGKHWTPSSRAYHWKAVRVAAGWTGDVYLATRHFAAAYMINELEMPSEDVAIALGHTDGGELVRRRYGHRDKERALDRVVAAYEGMAAEETHRFRLEDH